MARSRLPRIFRRFKTPESQRVVIIVGTDYTEYRLFRLMVSRGHKVHCFITDDPWKYNTDIDGVMCRYPSELPSLCERHEISDVFYCDDRWLDILPTTEYINLIRHS